MIAATLYFGATAILALVVTWRVWRNYDRLTMAGVLTRGLATTSAFFWIPLAEFVIMLVQWITHSPPQHLTSYINSGTWPEMIVLLVNMVSLWPLWVMMLAKADGQPRTTAKAWMTCLPAKIVIGGLIGLVVARMFLPL